MMYKTKLIILGKEWSTTGKTLDEALAAFELDWVQIKGKGVLTVSYGDKRHEHLFNMKDLRKIFSNKIIRMKWAQRLEYLLKADYKSNVPTYADIDITVEVGSEKPVRKRRKAKSSA